MYDSIRPYNIAERRRIQKASALYETHLENILDLLSARGISEETARYHHLGYIDNDPIPGHEDYNQCITIPYMYPVWGRPAEIRKMRFRCSLQHDCKTHNHPKYLTPAGDTGSIYNMAAMVNPAAEMHICEGEFDSMILEQCGWPAVAIPGATSWQNFWTKFFEGYDHVYIWSDPDPAGDKMAQTLQTALPQATHVPLTLGDVTDTYLKTGKTGLTQALNTVLQ